jgi:Fe2+ transport system protein FeoA
MILQIAAGLIHRTRAAFRLDAPAVAPLPAGLMHLGQVPLGATVELVRMEMPEETMEALLERGLMPGCRICPVRRAPSGDPILLVDGSLLALRRETAACLLCMGITGSSS